MIDDRDVAPEAASSTRVPVPDARPRPQRRRLRTVALAAAVAVAAVAGATGLLLDGPDRRDPLLWPFAQDSIWNTPIGSDARYVPADLQPALAEDGYMTVDPEHISLDSAAPLRTLRPFEGQAGGGARVHVREDLGHDGSYNGCATLLAEDGRHVWQGQPLDVQPGQDPTWRYTIPRKPVDLRGPGLYGCHGGSGLSGIGGSLRVGELDSDEPLRHALKINLHCAQYCWKGEDQSDSKRWPARTADSYWDRGYGGSNPALRMGALLALRPDVDLSGITHPKARKIAEALRDYGGYLVDDTAYEVHALAADERLLSSEEYPPRADTAFHEQLQEVFTQLSVVDNNGPDTIGGGGTPRAALAPCFEDQDDARCE